MSSFVQPTVQELNNGLGARYIACTVNLILEGFVAAQTWHYFTTHGNTQKEPKALQFFAALLFLCTLIQSVLLFNHLYTIHVLNFLNPDFLTAITKSYGADIYMTAIITGICQSFFAWRCYKLMNRPWWLLVGFPVAILLVFGSGINLASVVYARPDYKLLRGAYVEGSLIAWIVSTTTVEIMITSMLIYRFRDVGREMYFAGTKNVITRFLMMSMTTCFVATSVMVMMAILYFGFPKTTLFVLGCEPFPKIYACSVFVQLNSRRGPISREGTELTNSSDGSGVKSGSSHPTFAVSVNNRSFVSEDKLLEDDKPQTLSYHSGVVVRSEQQVYNEA